MQPNLGPRRLALAALAVIAVVLLLVLLYAQPGTAPARAPTPSAVSPEFTAAALRVLTDGGNLSATVGSVVSLISDSVTPGASSGTSRSYDIRISVSQPLPAVALDVQTSPLVAWGQPDQLPGGMDVLPSVTNWTWSVMDGHTADTANWSYLSSSQTFERQILWTNQTYEVVGKIDLTVHVAVDTGTLSGARSPAVGVVLSYGSFDGAPVSGSNSDLLNLTQALDPPLERISLSGIGSTYTWNLSKKAVVVNFTRWDAAYTLAAATHSAVYMDFPAGTWGNGNNLPNGTPLNLSDPVPFEGVIGYFPTTAAYTKFVQSIVTHVRKEHETVTYWNVGNEVPLVNSTIVAEYIQLFNAAEATIHATFPKALVGSDVMTRSSTYLPVFAADAKDVGYLSFHYYSANKICTTPQYTYCPPNGTTTDPTSPEIWANASTMTHKAFLPPASAQSEWHNLTGKWIPIFDAETNLNAAGGPYTAGGGTDPRIPTTFNAAWLVSTMISSAEENVSAVTYFTLNGPSAPTGSSMWAAGGWGFGLVAQSPGYGPRIYAPYWALEMWSKFLPAGSKALVSTSSDPSVVRAFAVQTSSGISVVLVNGVNLTVHVQLSMIGGSHTAVAGEAVDHKSYVETYNPANGTVYLAKSGIRDMPAAHGSGTLHLTLYGYGAGFVEEQKTVKNHHKASPRSAVDRAPAAGTSEPVPTISLPSSVPPPVIGLSTLGIGTLGAPVVRRPVRVPAPDPA